MPGTAAIAPITALADGEQVEVRMYRGILGDCFLLSHRIGDRSFNALIDCGALQCIGTAKAKESTQKSLDRLGTVVDALVAEHPRIDLVIATHEHYDHLSGFIKYSDAFRDPARPFEIGEVWMAWTENDGDELAVAIRERRSKGLAALNALASGGPEHLDAFGLDSADKTIDDRIDRLRDLLQFYGELDPWVPGELMGLAGAKSGGAAAKREPKDPPRSCNDALAWLKRKAGDQKVRYLDPGQQIRFGLDDRLQATVLGPPRTRARLLQMDPSSDPATKEVYLASQDDYAALISTMTRKLDRRAALALGMELPSDVEEFAPVDPDLPFDEKFNHTRMDAAEQSDDGRIGRIAELYYDNKAVDRRIDGDWLGAAETLGLKIDGDVNNTSLALAIEVPGRHVLLFPADAQVGNWLSWHDQTYPSKPNVKVDGGETASDILSRVVLYKVGHHGSHNATAKAKGLELMTSPHLAAMIPVVEEVAREQKNKSNPNGWAMPYDDLYSRLKAKTAQRIVRGDGDLAAERAAFANSIFTLDYAADDPADPLWVSLRLG